MVKLVFRYQRCHQSWHHQHLQLRLGQHTTIEAPPIMVSKDISSTARRLDLLRRLERRAERLAERRAERLAERRAERRPSVGQSDGRAVLPSDGQRLCRATGRASSRAAGRRLRAP